LQGLASGWDACFGGLRRAASLPMRFNGVKEWFSFSAISCLTVSIFLLPMNYDLNKKMGQK
jgi:hypothetical protein